MNNGTRGVRYPPSLWMYDSTIDPDVPRTNKAIEGWHSVFNSTFSSSSTSLTKSFTNLKREDDAIRIKSIRLDAGQNLLRKKICDNGRNIQRFLV